VTVLIVALALFVGSHFLMSHPLRALMVARFGATGFQGVYSLISIASFVWVILAFQAAPQSAPLWAVGDGLWAFASLLMLAGSILFAGSIIGNPALPQPGADALAAAPARGVFAITRHPMMWGFALWGVVHILVAPHAKGIILCTAMIVLALGGSVGQDQKKAVLMGDSWRDWARRTSFVPFGNQFSGRSGWGGIWPGSRIFLGGVLFWLVATYGHAWFGIYGAGLWRWLWAG
jgi:uncharacterized membrane protein